MAEPHKKYKQEKNGKAPDFDKILNDILDSSKHIDNHPYAPLL